MATMTASVETVSKTFRMPDDGDVVADGFPYRMFSRVQRDLLELIPFPGATIELDDALAVLGHDHSHPYGQIIVLMNSGLVEAEYDKTIIDPPIVLRRM